MTGTIAFFNQVLTASGVHTGSAVYKDGQWKRYEVQKSSQNSSPAAFLADGLPYDIHCHGYGGLDFSRATAEDIEEIDRMAAAQGIICVPTIYLRRERLEPFEEMLAAYDVGRRAGKYRNLAGFALEGPMLSSAGGTPKVGTWRPTKSEWERIGQLGEKGLRYSVISPDVLTDGATEGEPTPDWVVTLLVRAGIKPAIGHFKRDNPERSAECVERILDQIERTAGGADSTGVITDHLFNDMPLNFQHTWRTASQRENRDAELNRDEWSWDQLSAQVGPVPAAIMRGARDKRLTLCMNFDGEHVDHEYCRRTVKFLGAENMIAITDRTDTKALAGEVLHQKPDSTLMWQDEGLVAAGTQSIPKQMRYMNDLGISQREAWMMFLWNPSRVFAGPESSAQTDGVPPELACAVAGPGDWIPLQVQHG